jgi:hypothetical protein
MIPDRLPESLREVISDFPPGSLQFEVGIQTFNEEVSRRIQRRQNGERLEENLRFLRHETGVHVHADLIAGLPGESLESFAAGFDRLVALGPQEIQVGILKRLRGTPIVRHVEEWKMVYNAHPPYEIMQTSLIDFATMQRLRRFARYWDLVSNSGNFVETAPLLWRREEQGKAEGDGSSSNSAFYGFMRWSEWLFARVGRTESIALVRLMELLFQFLTRELRLNAAQTAASMWRDYQRGGRRDKPAFLKEFLPREFNSAAHKTKLASRSSVARRQARHLAQP